MTLETAGWLAVSSDAELLAQSVGVLVVGVVCVVVLLLVLANATRSPAAAKRDLDEAYKAGMDAGRMRAWDPAYNQGYKAGAAYAETRSNEILTPAQQQRITEEMSALIQGLRPLPPLPPPSHQRTATPHWSDHPTLIPPRTVLAEVTPEGDGRVEP